MPDNRREDLSRYRMNTAEETMDAAQICMNGKHYKDAVNRSYYAAFYAVKAVLALEEKDFKRHKDVVAYFNQHYVATDIFPKEIGRKLARLQQRREKYDYDDFVIVSKEDGEEQILSAQDVINAVKVYLEKKR